MCEDRGSPGTHQGKQLGAKRSQAVIESSADTDGWMVEILSGHWQTVWQAKVPGHKKGEVSQWVCSKPHTFLLLVLTDVI